MMKKQETINFDVKSNLAKLLATENLIVQHNNVKTASFDVKNRVLTLPIFKEQKGDVYDMLTAHECAHALWTPQDSWEEIASDNELRSYVNVIEDTRIDKLIQKKYPGIVRNYQNGFDILDKQDFFGLVGKNINKDLMIIDKINLRSKSLNRLPFDFNDQDNEWLDKVDAVKTFDDVVALAKEMIDWQKKQVEEMSKLPNFDELSIAKVYNLENDDDDFEDYEDETSGADEENSDDADEKNDFNNFGDQKADDEKDAKSDNQQSAEKSNEESQEQNSGSPEQYGNGAGGDVAQKLLRAVTNDTYEEKQETLVKSDMKGKYVYADVPKCNLKNGALVSYKDFIKEMKAYEVKSREWSSKTSEYRQALNNAFKKFQNDNKKTVMYLVKEFEMKKSAQAYKRANTDKTGIIDPLKLHKYKYTEDIFKRLTVLPDGKNHGMMMLLDWSGSMSDCLSETVEQLLNLVEFCRKVNIPHEVYFFTSERNDNAPKSFTDKTNNSWYFENFSLVNVFSHRMTKKEYTESATYMYHMALYYKLNYTYSRKFDNQFDWTLKYDSFGIPNQFYLGNTPLNEALLYCNELVPMFKKKYDIEKMTFITLTDGGANSFRKELMTNLDADGFDLEDGMITRRDGSVNKRVGYDDKAILQINGKRIPVRNYNVTTMLLDEIKSHDVNVLGFFVLKRVRRWDLERYTDGDYNTRDKQYAKLRKEMTKENACMVDNEGYDKYFLLNAKKMNVENFDLSNASVKTGKTGELKRLFGKSMQSRLISRVVLNKFIKEVA